jgi:hypothetical protein
MVLGLVFVAACGGRARLEHVDDAAAAAAVDPASAAASSGKRAPASEANVADAEAPAGASDGVVAEDDAPPATAPYDHAGWDALLRAHVTADGGFRYEALRASPEHRAALERFVATIDAARPGSWSRDEQLAFYINAYNALTIDSVLDLWPVESVMREEGFFRARQHGVAGRRLTLDQLENEVIRAERFAEPRIHFVVNCASTGCPPLAPHALTAANLERTLAAATRAFVRRTTRLDRGGNRVLLCQIFEWFTADFDRAGGVRRFVSSQLDEEGAAFVRAPSTAIGHFRYDWSLNARD